MNSYRPVERPKSFVIDVVRYILGCDFFELKANLQIHGQTFANKFFRLRLIGDSDGWGTDNNQQSIKIRRRCSGFGSLAVAAAARWRWQRGNGGGGIYILDRVFIKSGIVLLS